jgi:hypothetical protein
MTTLSQMALMAVAMTLCSGRSLSQTPASAEFERVVKFEAVTAYGDPASYDLVAVRDRNLSKDMLTRCRGVRCTLPVGVYAYKLRRSETGDIVEGTVLIYQPDQVVTVNVGPAAGAASRDGEGYTVEGTVQPFPAGSPRWIRFQSPYSDWFAQVSISSQGTFRVEHLPPGTWIVLLYRAGKILDTRLVSTEGARSHVLTLRINVGSPPELQLLGVR